MVMSCSVVLSADGAQTALSNEPFSSSSAVTAKPNIMFVLDDSGSMKQDYLPDWAGPYQQLVSSVLTVITPAHRFFNNAFNGVAYNPATRYRPPVMYTSTGALDTTTYPSMTGTTTGTGGDSSATSGLPNWRAVKVDGYGIQSTATVNLEGQAFSYTTVPGEYCNSKQLRTCTASASATGSYTQPAYLRWCTTDALANDTTINAGTNCQASNIANSAANLAAGVTPYIYPRMPKPRTSTITVNAAGTVTGITVDTKQILNASATGAGSVDLATDIAAKINACTYSLPASSGCTVVGFSATTNGANVVVVTAPTITTSTPAISGGATTVTAFAGGNVPGGSLFTVITPSVTSYPFPGTASKGVNRVDCAGTTCTYAEEMTNYANWYAYYRTRMQMMKTASSVAFANVDDNFRVGYFTINNGSGSDFINLSAFDGVQKYQWYSKFFSAVPFGVTPLRTGLANAGKIYAGKISLMNSMSVTDPIQYSCQQNYTILSTDGYWNDASDPTKLDGTPIGEQDDKDPRPYYDGATNTRTVTRTTQTELQVGINTFLVESMTQQQQTSTSQLDQTVVTKDIYPWTTQTTTLQTRTTPLNKTDYSLVQSSYPLTSTTKQLQESTYKLNSTPRILQSYINNLTKTTTPLDRKVYNVTRSTQLVTKKDYNLTVGTRLVTQKVYNDTISTRLVSKKIYNLTVGTQLVSKKIYNVTSTTSALQSSTYKLKSSTRQLQKSMETSSDGGDTWQSTGWVDVSSCTTSASGPGYTRNTTCRYNTAVDVGGLNTCSTVAASTSSPYTVAQAVTCSYETTPIVAAVSTCTVVAQSGASPYTPSVSCGYSASTTVLSGQSACTAKNQTGSSTMTGDKVVCSYDTTPTTTSGLSTCTYVVPSPSASSPRTDCSYETATSSINQTSCTAAAAASATTNGAVWNTAVTCAYDSSPTTTSGLSTCTYVVPSPAASAPKTECSYETASTLSNQSSCTAATAASATTNGAVWNTAVTCSYDSTPTTTTGQNSCTYVVPSPAASGPKTECSYETASSAPNQSTCTAVTAASATTNGTVWNKAVTCAYDSTPTTTANLSTCTYVVPSPAASSPKTDCSYQTATTLPNQTSCTAAAAATATTDGSVWNTAVGCAYDATPTTTSGVSSCTWVVPSPAASASKTDCAYNAGAATTATVSTCTTVAQSTGSGNGTVWSGPAVGCAYAAAVLTGTNLTACTAGSASGGSPYNAYTTCGYINGTTTTGLNSCTKIADSPGPTNYVGPANACAYSGTASVANVTSCTAVAQDTVNFAQPQKTCAYEAVGTSATNLTTCTYAAQSSGAYPWSGPNVTCAYSGSASTSTPSTCTVNIEAGPSYTNGAKISCAYASGTTSNNVSSCTTAAKQTLTTNGAAYAPATDCAYGSTSGWSNASVACVPVAQTGSSPYAGPARDCQYTTPSVDTYTATCTAAAQNNTNLTARNCVAGSFPVTLSTVVTTVDSCPAGTTTNGATPVERTATTTCAYRSPVVTDTPTCTPVPASVITPTTTAITAVTCPVTNTAQTYVPVSSCTYAGALPAAFDASGKIVVCRKTDQVGTTAPITTGTIDGTSTTAVTPALTATCTPGIDAGTQAQTKCTTLLSTGPTPVQSCTTVDPAVPPSYVKTTCVTTTTPTTVMGCTEELPSSPLWETVSCSYNDDGTKNTLADVAAYYYKTDLRTVALGNCTGAVVSPATTGNVLCSATDDMNNVRASATDPNAAQHMTTFTLGLGASGYMKYSDTYATDSTGDFPTVKGVSPYRAIDGITADPSTGLCSWQPNGLCNWPFPPVTGDEQTTIDDLWHAGVNGHGAYYSARDPASLSAGISSALNGVAAAGGYAAAPSLSTPNLVLNDNYLFTSSFVSLDWTGDLMRWRVDPYSGKVVGVRDWSAQAKLDAKAYTSRVIYTYDASVTVTKLRAFTSANFGTNSYFNTPYISATSTGLTQFLCTSPDICLSATDQDNTHAAGSNLVNYLRGDRTNEGTDIDNTKYYRQRQHVLGDIVNAQSVYVYKPLREYTDPGYAAFRLAQDSRQAVVYSAANDGMLHAFAAKGNATTEGLVDSYASAYAASQANPANAALLTTANTASAAAAAAIAADTTIGQELWAYIPSMALPKLYKLADKKYRNMHRYLVDSTPVSADICASNCGDAATAVWKTILVGGLGHGGRGYYALDITDPANPKALWEFTHANLGYSYGNPQITKLSNGTWVVMLSSGYNNIPNDDGSGGDGVGRLFILNAVTGAQITGLSPISTGFGDATTPSGLGNISNIVVNPQSDNTVIAVYGGDLYGNLWRFDVNDVVGPAGTEAQLLAVLKDATGNTQPITTKPIVADVKGQKVVYVGTGRFLDSIDISDTSQQSLYAIKDPWTTGGTAATAIFDNPGGDRTATGRNTNGFVRQVNSWVSCPAATLTTICTTGDQVMISTNNAVNFASDNGWFVDLINSAEKANTNPALGLGMLVYTTNAPSLLACDIGGKSYLYFINYLTGGPILSAGNAGGVVGYLLSNSFASAPSIVVRATPTGGTTTPVILVAVAAPSTATGGSGSGSTSGGGLGGPVDGGGMKSPGTPLLPVAMPTRRAAWRELIAE
jgi:Tfp pilus tip-associated adhesin PilY1